MKSIHLSHNDKTISGPIRDDLSLFVILTRCQDGSIDVVFTAEEGDDRISETWYYNEIKPGDKLNFSIEDKPVCHPKPQDNSLMMRDLHYYNELKNILTKKDELYSNNPSLGIELCTSDGVFTGLLHGRIASFTLTCVRNRIIAQLGAMDRKTFELFTWYYKEIDSAESLLLQIGNIEKESEHLVRFPSKMKIPSTATEVSENKIRQEKGFYDLENRLRTEGVI